MTTSDGPDREGSPGETVFIEGELWICKGGRKWVNKISPVGRPAYTPTKPDVR